MTVHNVGSRNVALYIEENEMEAMGLSEQSLSRDRARALAMSAFDRLGLKVDGEMEIEAFTGSGGVMVFAAVYPRQNLEPLFFSFPGLEPLLDALRVAPELPSDASVFRLEEDYILFLRLAPCDFMRLALVFSEYARRLFRPAEYALFLAEHGRLIADDVERLRVIS